MGKTLKILPLVGYFRRAALAAAEIVISALLAFGWLQLIVSSNGIMICAIQVVLDFGTGL